jgi:hypothetical protein
MPGRTPAAAWIAPCPSLGPFAAFHDTLLPTPAHRPEFPFEARSHAAAQNLAAGRLYGKF